MGFLVTGPAGSPAAISLLGQAQGSRVVKWRVSLQLVESFSVFLFCFDEKNLRCFCSSRSNRSITEVSWSPKRSFHNSDGSIGLVLALAQELLVVRDKLEHGAGWGGRVPSLSHPRSSLSRDGLLIGSHVLVSGKKGMTGKARRVYRELGLAS